MLSPVAAFLAVILASKKTLTDHLPLHVVVAAVPAVQQTYGSLWPAMWGVQLRHAELWMQMSSEAELLAIFVEQTMIGISCTLAHVAHGDNMIWVKQ